ncbi:MAG: hypothetical protein IJ115_02130 [Erysipelotrichaceae bacterium]|nr:hypothetical protein [Erysipelotrichaceae bacterium]
MKNTTKVNLKYDFGNAGLSMAEDVLILEYWKALSDAIDTDNDTVNTVLGIGTFIGYLATAVGANFVTFSMTSDKWDEEYERAFINDCSIEREKAKKTK